MAKTLMIQGTASDVGKSVITTALCRIFSDAGYKTAPFKAQNMALNSHVTGDGREIGRAQAVQAEAARIEATAEMNPILLKPMSDNIAQVVVMGRSIGNLSANEFYYKKHEFIKVIAASLDKLMSNFDVVVIEGAGSPAEINLMERDIVNMKIAGLAGAPVILTADIDRGGVFAHIIGTLDLLGPEADRVKGFLINKFRGQESLLSGGIEYLEKRTGIPVVGVVPFIKDLDIGAEDSVCLDNQKNNQKACGTLDIAVVKLPQISNFTDIDALRKEPGLKIRYAERPSDIKDADCVILPGTKTTILSLIFLRECGLDEAIKEFAASNKPVFGICGGFQLLGEKIIDPEGVESHYREAMGLGLLPIDTLFYGEKLTQRSSSVINGFGPILTDVDGVEIRGYEIHHGISTAGNGGVSFSIHSESGEPDGAISENGLVIGSYVHGIFDNDLFRKRLLEYLMTTNDKHFNGEISNRAAFKEMEYDRLAEIISDGLDTDYLFGLMELTKAKV